MSKSNGKMSGLHNSNEIDYPILWNHDKNKLIGKIEKSQDIFKRDNKAWESGTWDFYIILNKKILGVKRFNEHRKFVLK